MSTLFHRRGLVAAFIAALAFTASGSAPADTSLAYAAAKVPAAAITERDVTASNAKVQMAAGALLQMWSTDFNKVGERFNAPGFVRYRGAIMSPCGVMRPSNAGYCPRDNNVYFDEVFVAATARDAGSQLGTDGDMAAVGIIAHEVGHAVAIQLGHQSRSTYENEAVADCLAGAFADQSKKDGSLENGDLDEAFYGMYQAGDPEPELTGDARRDNRILRLASMMGHGTRDQRLANFRKGLNGGAGSCLPEFAGIR
jgi:predicted metalloprotease